MKRFSIISILAATVAFTTPSSASEYQQPAQNLDRAVYCNGCRSARPATRYMAPVTVHAGRTVTVTDHYDVYRPKVVYEKVNTYSTSTTCTTCK